MDKSISFQIRTTHSPRFKPWAMATCTDDTGSIFQKIKAQIPVGTHTGIFLTETAKTLYSAMAKIKKSEYLQCNSFYF